MTEIEKMMSSVDTHEHQYGSQPYENWVVTQLKENLGRDMLTCLEHLKFYNNSLMINDEIRSEDALRYLRENIEQHQESTEVENKPRKLTEMEFKLRELKDKATAVIRQGFEVSQLNPGLRMLQERLLEKLSCRGENGFESKGIIFVRTRFVAEALVDWLGKSQALKNVVKKPTSVIGCGQRNGKGNIDFMHCDLWRRFQMYCNRIWEI
jgi:ERCC4-related helicase